MKKSMRPFLILPMTLIALMSGCSKKSLSADSAYSMASREAEYASEDVRQLTKEEIAPSEAETPAIERKLIRTGNIRVEVQSLSGTRQDVDSLVSRLNGYISSSSESADRLTCRIRIPAQYFDSAMDEISALGRIRSREVNAEDVTDSYYDIQTRLDTKLILQKRYQEYLSEAKNVEDLLSVERSLNDVTGEIESMKGQLKLMNSQIDYSTIVLNAILPPNQTEQGFTLPDTRNSFKNLLGNAAGFFNGILFFLLYLLIFGIPAVLIAALLWWLCFGKIGLVKKLFSRANRGKKQD